MVDVHHHRRAPRRPVRMEADLIASRWDEPRRHALLDLGFHGVRVQGDELLGEGEHVVLSFRPPGGRLGELTLFARVAHARRIGMGLELLELPQDARAELERAVQRSRRTRAPAFARDEAAVASARDALLALDHAELTPTALGGLLTGGRTRAYRWCYTP